MYSRFQQVKRRLSDMVGIRRSLPNFRNNRKLEKLRNIHLGNRCFIIGNGPSLKIEDLELLKNEITFASNRIFLAYDQTAWRPTYYTLADEVVAQNNLDQIRGNGLGGQAIFNSSVFKYARSARDAMFCNPPTRAGELAWDPVLGVRAGHSIINLGLKLAYFMGIREVFVIGCDHSFEDRSTRTGEMIAGNEIIISKGEKNHFHPEYRKEGESWTVPKMDLIAEDFAVAKNRYTEAGGVIYNASRKSALNVWPRVDLDDIIT